MWIVSVGMLGWLLWGLAVWCGLGFVCWTCSMVYAVATGKMDWDEWPGMFVLLVLMILIGPISIFAIVRDW